MAKWALVVMLVGACGSKADDKPSKTPGVTRVPTVSVASVVIAAPANPPPILIVLDARNELHAARISTWDLLSTKDPLVGAARTTLLDASSILREGRAMAQAPDRIYESFKNASQGVIDLEALEDHSNRMSEGFTDDPPPPEEEEDEEDKEDAPEDFSGVNVAVTLDEGKMGKKESDRAEGQYRMKKEAEDPQLVVQQIREHALSAARMRLHQVTGAREPNIYARKKTDVVLPLAGTVTEWVPADELENPPFALLLAAPDGNASDFVTAVGMLSPLVAVNHGGKVRPLRLETIAERSGDYYNSAPEHWIELTVGTVDMSFEAVPERPIPLTGAFDQPAFTEALDRARKSRDLDPLTRVDVLVDPNVSVQRLIDVLVALDQAGVVMIGLGEPPDPESPEQALRGERPQQLRLGPVNLQGDLDKAIIRRYIKLQRDKMLRCYADTRRSRSASARGQVSAQFFVTPNGNVATSSASGVHFYLADCVASTIKAIEFPKPKGGGGVQVNVTFTFDY